MQDANLRHLFNIHMHNPISINLLKTTCTYSVLDIGIHTFYLYRLKSGIDSTVSDCSVDIDMLNCWSKHRYNYIIVA